jgi:hypothetical protein
VQDCRYTDILGGGKSNAAAARWPGYEIVLHSITRVGIDRSESVQI